MSTGPNSATSELLPVTDSATAPVDPGWRRRRLWLSSWRRLTRWEYWPIWAVYGPLLPYFVWLAVRYRGATVFTAVNPGMPAASGLVGRSKAEILAGLAEASDRVAPWTRVAPGEFPQRNAAIRLFMADHGLAYPIVLKPDRGERGAGVVIARSARDVESALRETAGSLVVQAYVAGVEFGVFYVRHPEAEEGEIFAVTEKHNVVVEGDGERTLEALILQDNRAVGMVRYFLSQFASRLAEVPARGERVLLGELGTHCRGALFLDGMGRVTSRMAQEIDRVSRAYPGFHFGRYDVRAESVEAFQRGEFRVIELNGVTSEATSIYDPRHSVLHAWRTLARQWRLAFAIGAANRERGAPVSSIAEVVKLLREHTQA